MLRVLPMLGLLGAVAGVVVLGNLAFREPPAVSATVPALAPAPPRAGPAATAPGQRGVDRPEVVAAIRRLLEPAAPSLFGTSQTSPLHPELESAALIALAKSTQEARHADFLLRWLSYPADRHGVVRDAAALSLGLLRRTDRRERFDQAVLDRVRARLFSTASSPARPQRTRAFAAVALGLLGDQPGAAAALPTLFERLIAAADDVEVAVGLLLAIGMHPPEAATPAQHEILSELATQQRLVGSKVDPLIQAHAAQALGRLGDENALRPLENVMRARRGVDHRVRRSAAIALGLLGRRLKGPARSDAAAVLVQVAERTKDNSTRNFALIALAQILAADMGEANITVLSATGAAEMLLATARNGSYMEKPYAALGLGLALQGMGEHAVRAPHRAFAAEARAILRMGALGVADLKGRAAFCTAAGLAGQADIVPALRGYVAEEEGNELLRGYAAEALGRLAASPDEVAPLLLPLLDPSSTAQLQRQAAVAFGRLAHRHGADAATPAVSLLLARLSKAPSADHRGAILLRLMDIGDERPVPVLLGLLEDRREDDLVRALACAALGRLFDPERIPSLSRAIQDLNYRASTDMIDHLRDIL